MPCNFNWLHWKYSTLKRITNLFSTFIKSIYALKSIYFSLFSFCIFWFCFCFLSASFKVILYAKNFWQKILLFQINGNCIYIYLFRKSNLLCLPFLLLFSFFLCPFCPSLDCSSGIVSLFVNSWLVCFKVCKASTCFFLDL